MAKFHINKHGVPAPCHAKKGNCPLGGNTGDENHFDKKEDAQAYIDNKNAEEFGYLSTTTPEEEEASRKAEQKRKIKANKRINKARDEFGSEKMIEEISNTIGDSRLGTVAYNITDSLGFEFSIDKYSAGPKQKQQCLG